MPDNDSRLFSSRPIRSEFSDLIDKMRSEIKAKGIEYVKGVNHEDWLDYFRKKLLPIPLSIDGDNISLTHSSLTVDAAELNNHLDKIYDFELHIPYSGSGELFRLTPSARLTSAYDAEVRSNGVNGVLVHRISTGARPDAHTIEHGGVDFLPI